VAGNAFCVTNATVDVSLRIERPDGVRRLGQALWMMIGRPIRPPALIWARGLLGENGEALLWTALCEERAVREPDFLLAPEPLAKFLCRLWSGKSAEAAERAAAKVIWTFPPQLTVDGIARDGYLCAVLEMIASATATLTLVSPYLEPRGIGRLHEEILGAVHRGVAVSILTHDADDLSSLASASLETLRRDSVGVSRAGSFTVFTASMMPQALLHLKIVLADDVRAVLGSANVTAKGLGANLEAGVILGRDEACVIGSVIKAVIATGLVAEAFSSR
jgi:phosphatidylserine/phosphatidylglycerophosphate/cardiolipin synthase-like enzyme